MSTSGAASVLGRLNVFRRRATLALFLQRAAQTFVLLGIAGIGLVINGFSPAWQFAIVAAAVSLFVASVATIARRPELRATANAIDAYGRFENVVVTALQFAHSEDCVAALIVRDAERRLAGIQPAAVFPIRLGVSHRAVGAAIGISALVFLTVRTGHVPAASSLPADGPTAAFSAGDGSAPPPEAVALAKGSGPSGAQRQVRVADPRDTTATQSTDTRPAGQGDQAASRPAIRDGTASASTQAPAAPSPTDAEASAAPRGAASSSADGHSVGGVRADSPAAVPASRLDGAGVAGSRPPATAARAGGARGGSLDAGAAGATRPTPPPQYAERYRTAAARMEQALEQQRIPAGLRDVVRAYFTAIRP